MLLVGDVSRMGGAKAAPKAGVAQFGGFGEHFVLEFTN
jgi:hypothetical protein